MNYKRLKQMLDMFTREWLISQFDAAGGDVALFAKRIGVTRPNGYKMVKRYKLSVRSRGTYQPREHRPGRLGNAEWLALGE